MLFLFTLICLFLFLLRSVFAEVLFELGSNHLSKH